jgi:RNA polymerase sigma-70 factor (ECF subfamily)
MENQNIDKYQPPGWYAIRVEKTLAGDKEAFADMVDACMGLYYSIAWSQMGNREAAEDIIQEAIYEIYRSLPNLEQPKRFIPWSCTILRRVSYHSRKKQAAESEKLQQYYIKKTIEQETADHTALLPHSLKPEDLEEAIQQLPAELREPLGLFYNESIGVKDIAGILNQTPRQIEYRLARAKIFLKRLLSR